MAASDQGILVTLILLQPPAVMMEGGTEGPEDATRGEELKLPKQLVRKRI